MNLIFKTCKKSFCLNLVDFTACRLCLSASSCSDAGALIRAVSQRPRVQTLALCAPRQEATQPWLHHQPVAPAIPRNKTLTLVPPGAGGGVGAEGKVKHHAAGRGRGQCRQWRSKPVRTDGGVGRSGARARGRAGNRPGRQTDGVGRPSIRIVVKLSNG